MQRALLAVLIVVAACSRNERIGHAEQDEVRWTARLELATGGGQRGPWRQNNSDFDYVDDPTVALDRDGSTVVAWVDQARKDVLLQRFTVDGDPEHPPINVSRSPDVYSWLPRLALRGSAVYVLWQEIVFSGGSHGGDAFFARSRDGGATFEAPQNLSRSRGGDGKGRITDDVWHNGSIDLAVGGDDTVFTTWTDFEGALWFARSLDAGATFSAPYRLFSGRGAARAPALASAGETVFLAWTVGDSPSADLQLAISRDRGATFGAPQPIVRTAGYSDAPKLAIDRRGHLHVAWGESNGDAFGRYRILYTRSYDGGTSFEPVRELSGSDGSHAFPMLVVDAQRVVLTWEHAPAARQPARGLAMAYSLDSGTTFASPAPIAGSVDLGGGTNGSHQGRLMEKLAVRDGMIAVANSALAHGRGSRVWLVRGLLPGVQPARVTSRQRQHPTR